MRRYAAFCYPIVLSACGIAQERAPDDVTVEIENTGNPVALPSNAKAVQPPIRLSRAPAYPAKPQDGTACTDISGYLTDKDPAGRNIRSNPSISGKVLGVIPAQGKWDRAPRFDILESRNGWLKIQNAGFDRNIVEGNSPKTYAGIGWISGKGVGITLQTRLGYAAPSHDAPWLMDGRPQQDFDGLNQSAIVGCSGNWVLVDWPYDATPAYGAPVKYRKEAVISQSPIILRAWSTGVCNIQETTCDGVDGDKPAG